MHPQDQTTEKTSNSPLAYRSTAISSSNDPGLQLFLERLTARSVLSTDEQEAILSLPTHQVILKAKQDLVHADEETLYCCFVASGMLGRFGPEVNGQRQITAFHIPGDMADLHSVVRPVGFGGLTALCATTILRVPHAAIRVLAARYPAVAEAFWRDCMLDAAVLVQWVVNVGKRETRTRLAHIFCEMAIRSGTDREVLLDFALPLTQEQLADALAVTTEYMNRSLKNFRDQGLATFKAGTVHIHDWHRLVSLGEFDCAYMTADTVQGRQKRLLGDQS